MNIAEIKHMAVIGLKAEIARLQRTIDELEAPADQPAPAAEPVKNGRRKPRKKRKLSAEGRARIVAATKARWAAYHKQQKRQK